MLDKIKNVFRWLSVTACVFIFLLTFGEVTLRQLGIQFFLSYEYCGFLLGAMVFFSLPVVTANYQHICVIDVRSRGDVLSRARHGFAVVATTAYFLILLYLCSKTTLSAFNDGTRTQGIMRTPLYIPQLSMIVGLLASILMFVATVFSRLRKSEV